MFLPLCSNVSRILIESQITQSDCDKDFKIKYVKNSSENTFNGYLRENNIITQYSTKLVNCQNNDKSLLIMDSKFKKNMYLIRRSSRNVETISYNAHLTEFKIRRANLKDLFNHHEYLVNGSDFYEQMQMYNDNTDFERRANEGSSSNIFDGSNVVDNDILNQIASNIKDFFKFKFLSTFKQILQISFFIIVIFLILFFIYFVFKNIHIFQRILPKKNIHSEHLEMDNFFDA